MDLDRKLIKEVQNQQVLYDPSHSLSKDIDYKHKIWMEISRKLIGGEDEITSVTALKVRWKSLRDAYVKERKYDLAKTYGVKIKMKKPWRLKKQMEFLAPFIHNRKELTFDSAKENNEKNVNGLPKRTKSLQKTTVITEMVSEPAEESSSETIKPRRNLFNQPIPESNNYRLIEIDSFFRNISDAVKTLNAKNQVMVQRDVTNLVMNYKLKELEAEDDSNL